MANREENASESQQYVRYNIAPGNEEPLLNQPNPTGSNVLYYGISVTELKRLTELRKDGKKIVLDLSDKQPYDHEQVENPTYYPGVDYAQQGQMYQTPTYPYPYQYMPPNANATSPYSDEREYYNIGRQEIP